MIHFRSLERDTKKTSYPKWMNKLPDAAKSGGNSGADTSKLAPDDKQISSEKGVIPGYKVSLSHGSKHRL